MTLETRLKGMSFEDVKEAWECAKKTPKQYHYSYVRNGVLYIKETTRYLNERKSWSAYVLSWIDNYDEYMTEIEGDDDDDDDD